MAAGGSSRSGRGPPVASMRMDETHAATAATFRAARRRPPWLLPGCLTLLLALLTFDVVTDGPLVGVDQRIRRVVESQAHSARWHWVGGGGHAPAVLLTQLGNNQVAVPLLALAALIVAIRHRSVRPLIAAVIGVTLLLGTVIPAKILIARAGPGLPPVAHGAMGVFPSGHTATSSVCLGLAALLLARGQPDWARRAVLAVMAVVCFLVGAALIWGDYHWFTDVVAGWALAALIVMAALRATGLGGNPGGPVDRVRGGADVSTDTSREQADESARA
jgi:membrane-associated phospholipid phosphatase